MQRALIVVVSSLVVVASGVTNEHCPHNCVPVLASLCDTVEEVLGKVPIIEKQVPFVLDIVGRAICFPEEKKPNKDSLCPVKCGKPGKSEEIFSKVCIYVDDILQATPLVSQKIRNLTDAAICAIGDLIPVEEILRGEVVNVQAKDSHDKHCPSNCVDEMIEVCDTVEGLLEGLPVAKQNPVILDVVGKALCFPESPKPNPHSLCPKKCGREDDEDSQELFSRVCNYVDNILQSIPGVSEKVRNLTDIAICTIGKLIPDAESLKVANVEKSQFCPNNCVDELAEVCEFVENLISSVPAIKESADKEIGRAICFPKTSQPHGNSFCLKECGSDQVKKVCEYVDLLMQVPEIPDYARNMTATVICKLGSKFQKELVAAKQQAIFQDVSK